MWDVLYVPRTGSYYVGGSVERPGKSSSKAFWCGFSDFFRGIFGLSKGL